MNEQFGFKQIGGRIITKYDVRRPFIISETFIRDAQTVTHRRYDASGLGTAHDNGSYTMSNEMRRLPAQGNGELSKGEIFDVLQNQRRRYVLEYLKRYEEPVSLSDLAMQVAAWEYQTPLEEVTDDQKKRVYTTLQQTHLERMEEAGIVEYDTGENVVTRTPYTDELTIYLEIVPGSEFPWREFYLSLGSISCAVVAALWTGLFPLTLLTSLEWATVIATTFTAAAAYHTCSGADLQLGDDEYSPDEFDR